MPSGNTTTDALADSLPKLIAGARIVREYEGVMSKLVDQVTLGEGIGLSWHEISLAQLTAQAIQETTVLDNPQQLSDALFTITPTIIGLQTLITDRVARRIDKKAFRKTGQLGQNAIQRKKDQDGLVVLDGASVVIGGAGTTLVSGHIGAAKSQISGNATEPGKPPYRGVLHSYQLRDIENELVAGVGTYPVAEGLTARVFAEGFRGMINSVQLYEDGNIVIDSSSGDAKGGVFSQDAIVLVQGAAPRSEVRREPHIGGGATSVFLYDEYAFGERSAGNWLKEILSDGTTPTS